MGGLFAPCVNFRQLINTVRSCVPSRQCTKNCRGLVALIQCCIFSSWVLSHPVLQCAPCLEKNKKLTTVLVQLAQRLSAHTGAALLYWRRQQLSGSVWVGLLVTHRYLSSHHHSHVHPPLSLVPATSHSVPTPEVLNWWSFRTNIFLLILKLPHKNYSTALKFIPQKWKHQPTFYHFW